MGFWDFGTAPVVTDTACGHRPDHRFDQELIKQIITGISET